MRPQIYSPAPLIGALAFAAAIAIPVAAAIADSVDRNAGTPLFEPERL